MTPRGIAAWVALSLVAQSGCRAPASTTPAIEPALAAVEAAYQDLRDDTDQIEVTLSRGAPANLEGVSLLALRQQASAARSRMGRLLDSLRPGHWSAKEQQALTVIRTAWSAGLGSDRADQALAALADSPDCRYDAEAIAGQPQGRELLTRRVYACYGAAARRIEFAGDTLDRLTILGLLATTTDPVVRERLFRALEPVWRAVNGDNGAKSPYRQLLHLTAAQWGGGNSPLETRSAEFNVAPERMEQWLVSILERWRELAPERAVEPWDFYYRNGAASRRLGDRIPLERLSELNAAYYRALGADPESLGIHYDLRPREGKPPVAFTTFGTRNRLVDGSWRQGQFWVFATYRVGGLDNLVELLHETGHAIHLAGIRTRPAFNDWPDSDTYTEALADIASLEVYEPGWQIRYLGDSVPLAQSLRGKYASVVMDIAWALFELRAHQSPDPDPNRIWTEITSQYLGIAPHPELSWWAMRGQLVDAPGYLLNYAIGYMISAELRHRSRRRWGSLAEAQAGWYPWMTERVYRFGLERPSKDVLRTFLGHTLSPGPLLADMSRVRPR